LLMRALFVFVLSRLRSRQLRDPAFVQQSEWQQFRHWVHAADSKPPLLSDVPQP
jgi:hypothetical protein